EPRWRIILIRCASPPGSVPDGRSRPREPSPMVTDESRVCCSRLTLGTPASLGWLTLPFAARYGFGGAARKRNRRGRMSEGRGQLARRRRTAAGSGDAPGGEAGRPGGRHGGAGGVGDDSAGARCRPRLVRAFGRTAADRPGAGLADRQRKG